MNHPPRIGCLIMAASRFGSNKLAAKVDGKMLIEHALETVPREEFARVTVVTQYDEVLVLARRFGFTVLVNPFPEWGASHTVRLGTEAMADCDAILYQVADQPLLRRESLEAMVRDFHAQKETERVILRLGWRAGGAEPLLGSPVLFGSGHFDALRALPEGKGGGVVIRQHPGCVRAVYAQSAEELEDADTVERLEALERFL